MNKIEKLKSKIAEWDTADVHEIMPVFDELKAECAAAGVKITDVIWIHDVPKSPHGFTSNETVWTIDEQGYAIVGARADRIEWVYDLS